MSDIGRIDGPSRFEEILLKGWKFSLFLCVSIFIKGERIGCGRGRGFVHGVDVIQKKGIDVNYQKKTLAKKKAGKMIFISY